MVGMWHFAGAPSAWIAAAWPSPSLQKGMVQISRDLHETLARPGEGSILHVSISKVGALQTTECPSHL